MATDVCAARLFRAGLNSPFPMASSLPFALCPMTRSSPPAPGAPVSREAQQQQDQEVLDRILGQGIKLPPQPRVVEQLQRQIQGLDTDLRAIARTIAQDAGITSLLFKAV